MRALFIRLYRFTGIQWPIGILVLIAIATFMNVRGWGEHVPALLHKVVWAAIAAPIIAIVAAKKYRRPSSTIDYREILTPLVRSEREYCLVLRPFGWDGQIVLPKLPKNSSATPWRRFRENIKRDQIVATLVESTGFTGNVTIEQAVATAARKELEIDTYGIVDQNARFAPPGPKFMRVPNDEWKMVVQRLIRRAHSIVLILPPGGDISSEGFTWEIEQIVYSCIQSRVILVLPPSDQDVHVHRAALQQACVLLALLHGSDEQGGLDRFKAYEYELQVHASTLLMKYTERNDVHWWTAVEGSIPQQKIPLIGRRRRSVTDEAAYISCLTEAFKETEHELSRFSFATRYPLR